jgi:nucleotide-binding universal stress UspA family protein
MRILLAIDGSPSSEAAIDEVCRRPWPAGSEARVVTVVSRLESMMMQAGSRENKAYEDVLDHESMETARHLYDIATTIGQRAPDLHVTPKMLVGKPKDAILDEAEQWGADLIVVGSHGYGPVRRFLLGSVSLAIALQATCSVEIVRSSPERLETDAKRVT